MKNPDEIYATLGLTDAIDSVLDIGLYNAEVEAERQDAAFLDEARQRACRALRDVSAGAPK